MTMAPDDEPVQPGPMTPEGAITVHTMGVHYRWQIPEVVRQQLRLAHSLREDLVTLQLAYDEDIQAIWSSYPTVAAAEAHVAATEAEAIAANEALKAARSAARGKRVNTAITERLHDARTALKAARHARREAIADVRQDRRAAPPRPRRTTGGRAESPLPHLLPTRQPDAVLGDVQQRHGRT